MVAHHGMPEVVWTHCINSPHQITGGKELMLSTVLLTTSGATAVVASVAVTAASVVVEVESDGVDAVVTPASVCAYTGWAGVLGVGIEEGDEEEEDDMERKMKWEVGRERRAEEGIGLRLTNNIGDLCDCRSFY